MRPRKRAPSELEPGGEEKEGESEAVLIPGLPDDISVLVLARLPRADLLHLKCVSKAWKRALEQPWLATTRQALGCAEEWLYVQTWNSVTGRVSWWAFDCSSPRGKWLCLPHLPRRRCLLSSSSTVVFGRASAVLNGKLYVLGGKAGEAGPTLRDLFMYCPLVNRWSRRKHMIRTRHSPLVSVLHGKVGLTILRVKLYVLGGFDWSNQRMYAAEVYDHERNKWQEIENTGHPSLVSPRWYQKDWRSEWQSIVIHNSSYYCSYTEGNGRAFVKQYDPETGNWKFKRPKLRALLRYGLSTVLAGKLHTIDWAAGRVRVADTNGMGWIHMKEIQGLPWVQIWRANPQMVGMGTSLFIVKRGLQIISIDVSKSNPDQVLRFWDAPTGPGLKDEEVISCQVLGL